MSSADWVEERLERRRWMARRELQARGQEVRRKRRQRVRDLARVALALTLVALGILALEIGRKAVTVMLHAQAMEQVRVS